MLQVHELGDNEERFKNREDDVDAVTKSTGLHGKSNNELNSRDANQHPERFPDPASVGLGNISNLVVLNFDVVCHYNKMVEVLNE